MERTNGYGGSGPLVWTDGNNRPEKLGFAETDVIKDGRPSSILFYQKGDQALMGDCRTASELKA